jgi:hypothetical protein
MVVVKNQEVSPEPLINNVAPHHTATATQSPQSHQTHSAKNPQVHPSASAKITLHHRHSLIGVGRPYFGVGTFPHSHILLWHTYPIIGIHFTHHWRFMIPSVIHFNSQHPYFSKYFSSLILIACGQSILSPGEMTSTAVLYTTETCIQRIQGSHKTTPFANRPMTLRRCSLYLLKPYHRSAFLHRLCQPSTKDRPTHRSLPT